VTDDEDRAVIVEPLTLRGVRIDARDRRRKRMLAEALAVARDIERSSRHRGARGALLAFRYSLDLQRLQGAARAAVEGAAWKLFRAGDARIWSNAGGDPGATRKARTRVLRRLFVVADDPLTLLDRAQLIACVREAQRSTPRLRPGRAPKDGFAGSVADALDKAGYAPQTIKAALRLLKLRTPGRRQRRANAVALLYAWPSR
jgi:hypothetical protein